MFWLYLFMDALHCSSVLVFTFGTSLLSQGSKSSYDLKVNALFLLEHPSTCKCFDPWDVEHLLWLLESWPLATSLTNFKHATKTATLSAVIMQNTVLTHLCYALIIRTFFFIVMLLFLFPHQVKKQVTRLSSTSNYI